MSEGRQRAYMSWRSMTTRCTDAKSHNYRWYGGRGVTICPEWSTFDGFYASMGDRPVGMTLERKDNSLGYSASNCIYATSAEQCRNRRSNVNITYDGRTQCLTDWCEEFDKPFKAMSKRLRLGWTFEEAVSIPLGQKRPGKYHPGSNLVEYQGERLPVTLLSERLFGAPGVISGRLHIGWPLEDAINTPRMSRGKKRKYLLAAGGSASEPVPFSEATT